MGRSRHTKGGQHAANKNQNKKARRTVKSVKKAVSKKLGKVGKTIGAGFSIGKAAYGKALRGAAANAATHIANSKYNKQLRQANWTKRDMSKLTPQQQRKFAKLAEKTGRDYSMRKPTFRLNINADTIAKFGGFADKGWYKGITKAIPGIKNLKINKQFYGNPMQKGWHYSQRTGRGHGIKSNNRDLLRPMPLIDTENIPESFGKPIRGHILPVRGSQRNINMGPKQDWLSELYSTHNINQGKLDQGARDYWSKAAKTQDRDAVIRSIIGTSKAEGTYGGRKKPTGGRRINTGRRARPHYRGRGKSKIGSVAKAVANKSLNII